SMCAWLLVLSTSKMIGWRFVGRSRSGAGGGTGAAKTGSGATTGRESWGSGSTMGGGSGSGLAEATSTGTAVFLARRRRGRPVLVRSMLASYGTRRRPATRAGGVAADSTDEEDARDVPPAMRKNPSFPPVHAPASRAGDAER